jgi:hypothetical protein
MNMKKEVTKKHLYEIKKGSKSLICQICTDNGKAKNSP